jgi:hypothetical protein
MCNIPRKTEVLYEMEEQIIRCWDISTDLDLLTNEYEDNDELSNKIQGIKNVYEMRFQKLWTLYEEAIKHHFAERNKHGSKK